MRPRENLIVYKSFNTLCKIPSPCPQLLYSAIHNTKITQLANYEYVLQRMCLVRYLCRASLHLRPNSWTKSRQKSSEFSSLKFTATSTALPWDFYFFKLTQPLTIFTIQLLYTVQEKGGKPDRKLYPPCPCFKKSIQKPQVWELSRLGPETSTKLYVHEFGFCSPERRKIGEIVSVSENQPAPPPPPTSSIPSLLDHHHFGPDAFDQAVATSSNRELGENWFDEYERRGFFWQLQPSHACVWHVKAENLFPYRSWNH